MTNTLHFHVIYQNNAFNVKYEQQEVMWTTFNSDSCFLIKIDRLIDGFLALIYSIIGLLAGFLVTTVDSTQASSKKK